MSSASADPAWRRRLAEGRLPNVLVEHVLASGYSDAGTFAFAFTDSEALEVWLEDMFIRQGFAARLGIDAARWASSPTAGIVRRIWHEACQTPTGSALLQRPAGGEWVDQPPPKLSLATTQEMKEKFGQCYPGVVLDENSLPGMRFWSTVYDMVMKKEFKYIPWTQIRSSAQESKILEERGRRSHTALHDLGALLRAATDDPPTQADSDIRGSWKVSSIFQIRRITFALCNACHLANHHTFDLKVLELFLQDHDASGLRGPNMVELMRADKVIFQKIFQLVNECDWSLDDALHEYSTVRSDMGNLLQPRPRPPPPARIEYVHTPAQRPDSNKGGGKPNRPPRTPKGVPKGGKRGGKDSGKGNGKRGDKSGGKKRGSPTTEGWDPSWFSDTTIQGNKVSFCRRWNVGDCQMRGCRFVHKCAVPKADGSPCNGNHRAIDHHAAAQPRT